MEIKTHIQKTIDDIAIYFEFTAKIMVKFLFL